MFRGRRCYSVTYISELANTASNAHIDDLFCTTSQTQQQQQLDEDEDDDEDSQSSSSEVSPSDSSRCRDGDEVTWCHGGDDLTELSRPRPTVDEMFCTERSTSDNSTCLSTDATLQRCASSTSNTDRKQVSQPCSGVTKVSVTRCGNWWRHPIFASKKVMTFLVIITTPTLSAFQVIVSPVASVNSTAKNFRL